MENIKDWRKKTGRPIIIAGPCSAESEEQLINTAQQLKELGQTDIFRAGIWKPRTRPGHFNGIGSDGLKWLKAVKDETGIPVATEVANQKHVYEALKYGIDVLWIGARTTTNPFTMEEIAETLRGVDVCVLIKNPVNPDVDLWKGAIERIMKNGISNVAAIHRGFTPFEKSAYRNLPLWQISIEMKRWMPSLPMIADPSHMGGRKNLLQEICQRAIDLDYEGLMIEAHHNPTSALSDKEQQITPNDLSDLLSSLVYRQSAVKENTELTIAEFRRQIDNLDDHLVDILERRMRVAECIGNFKRENKITILQSNRWDEILKRVTERANAVGLRETYISKIFHIIHLESIQQQNQIMNLAEKALQESSIIT
jgi:chorismate mutase